MKLRCMQLATEPHHTFQYSFSIPNHPQEGPRIMKSDTPESLTSDEQYLYEGNGTVDDPFVVGWLPNDSRNPL